MTSFSSKIKPFFEYFDICWFDISIYMNKTIRIYKKSTHIIKDISTENEYDQFVSNLQKSLGLKIKYFILA